MYMMLKGSEEEVYLTISRFLEANNYPVSPTEHGHIFQEVYNIAYAIKIAIR